MTNQIVWLRPGATAFIARCETCLLESEETEGARRLRLATFEGSLPAGADVAFRSCPRGHRVSVRRAERNLPRRAA